MATVVNRFLKNRRWDCFHYHYRSKSLALLFSQASQGQSFTYSTTSPLDRIGSVAGSDIGMVSEPSKPSSTWERGAISVKNTDETNPYLEAIRDTHDPSMHLKTIEDELKGTIGQALGKQSEKILVQVRLMSTEYEKYEKLLEEHSNNPEHPQIVEVAEQYNVHQQAAIKARWELIVHRQAAGFIVNNHSYVMKHYPISDPIPIISTSKTNDQDDDDHTNETSTNKQGKKKKTTKTFGDQLDWWQRIGRWK